MDERMAGGVNEVTRVADTVRRPIGEWTPAVHALLDHLAAVGFDGAPRVRGFDGDGREILDYVAGDVTDYPLTGYATSERALTEVARLLRRYHDATVGFTPPDGAGWQLPPREPAEVVCHGDVAPYNCVFRAGRPVALIDFDTAHPGPRRWDVAYAAYRFVPVTAPTNPDFTLPLADQAVRLRLFCDAYGLGAADRHVLLDTLVARLRALVAHIRDRADAGDSAFARHVAEGHVDTYLADIAYAEAHAAEFRRVLVGPAAFSRPAALPG